MPFFFFFLVFALLVADTQMKKLVKDDCMRRLRSWQDPPRPSRNSMQGQQVQVSKCQRVRKPQSNLLI